MMDRRLSIEGNARIDILNGALSAGKTGAHIAPSLSDVDICIAILQNMDRTKDILVLSKGHGALGYYAAMHQVGWISDEQFNSFEKDGGDYPGQPSRHDGNGITYSSGSLGMGVSYAIGLALAKKRSGGKVYVIVGDGELNEGSNWEAAALASRYKLDNLIVVVDRNDLQSDGNCSMVMGQDIVALWRANDWEVTECEGHSLNSIKAAIHREYNGKPLAIIAHTIKGKGVSFMEDDNSWHHAVLKNEDYDKAIQEIGEKYGLH